MGAESCHAQGDESIGRLIAEAFDLRLEITLQTSPSLQYGGGIESDSLLRTTVLAVFIKVANKEIIIY